MRTLAEFTKTTLIGGLLIILPVYVSLLLLAKAIGGLLALVKPITAAIPETVGFRQASAIVVLALMCFIAGLIARTRPGLRAKNAVEHAVLEKLPGYTLLRGLAGRRLRSQAHQEVLAWLHLDPWLLLAALALIPLALMRRSTRAIAIALLIQAAVVLKPGYLPNMYVIGMLPFAALIVPGSLDALWRWAGQIRFSAYTWAARTAVVARTR